MTDSHTRSKLWSEGYSATVPIDYRSSEFLQLKKYYLSSEPNKYHNCSRKQKKDQNDNDWLIFLLSFGLQQTNFDLNQSTDLENGNKLLRQAKLENYKDKFLFPKSICSTKDGIVWVADTGNNRLLGFNIGGVQVYAITNFEYKNKSHQLSIPVSVCSLVNGNVVVCNYETSIINIISHSGTIRSMFTSTSRPIAVDSDHSGTIFVLTESGTIEEFSRSGKVIRETKIKNDGTKIYTVMAVSMLSNEIFLGKVDCSEVLVISKWGDILRYLSLMVTGSGMNVFLSNLALTGANNILVSDHVNRSVHEFDSRTGKYKSTLINGKSGLGSVHAVCLSNENLLLTTEYSLNQIHCVKMFTYNSEDN